MRVKQLERELAQGGGKGSSVEDVSLHFLVRTTQSIPRRISIQLGYRGPESGSGFDNHERYTSSLWKLAGKAQTEFKTRVGWLTFPSSINVHYAQKCTVAQYMCGSRNSSLMVLGLSSTTQDLLLDTAFFITNHDYFMTNHDHNSTLRGFQRIYWPKSETKTMYKKSESNISVCYTINRADIRRGCCWYTILASLGDCLMLSGNECTPMGLCHCSSSAYLFSFFCMTLYFFVCNSISFLLLPSPSFFLHKASTYFSVASRLNPMPWSLYRNASRRRERKRWKVRE